MSQLDSDQIAYLVHQIKSTYPKDYLERWAEGHKYLAYQQDPVGFGRDILNERYTDDVQNMMESVRDYQMTVAISGNGTGKCVEENERIPLADGRMVRAKELIGTSFQVMAYLPDGTQKACFAEAFDNGIQSVYEVTTDHGRSITRTGNHPLWSAQTFKTKNSKCALLGVDDQKWMRVDDLSNERIVAVPSILNNRGTKSQDPNIVKLVAYLLADGGLTVNVSFSKTSGPIKEEFVEIVESMGCRVHPHDECTMRVVGPEDESRAYKKGSNPVLELVREWGLFGKKSKHKRFPDWIWELPNDQLAIFINRLFGCDGWACSDLRHCEIGYSSASHEMILDVEMAMLRLGISGTVRHRMAKCNGKRFSSWTWATYSKSEIVKFRDRINIFGKEKAVDKCCLDTKERTRSLRWPYLNLHSDYRWERIRSVEHLGLRPTVGIHVPGPNTYLTTFVEHNTHSSGSLALWFYKCYPNSIIFTAAAPPMTNLKQLLWGEIGRKISKNTNVFADDIYNVMHLSNSEWHYVTGVAIPQSGAPEQKMAKFSGKHAPNMLFIIDEADAVPDEIFLGIEGCMSGGNVRLLCMFNPRIMSGYVWRKIRDRQANVVHLSALNHPNVTSGKDVFPGAVSREITVKRINECSMPLYGNEEADEYCFEVPDFLVGCTAKNDKGVEYPPLQPGVRRVTDFKFFHQVLGRFGPQGANQLIPKDAIDRARMRWDDWVSRHGENPPEAVRPILGLDIADLGDDQNCLCKRYTDWVPRLERWSGIHPNETADKAVDIAKHVDSVVVNSDSIGVGADVAPLIRKNGVKAQGIVVSEKPTKEYKKDEKKTLKFHRLRDQLYWDVAEWFKSDTSMIPPDEKLIEEAMCITYEEDKMTYRIRVLSKDKMKDALGRSPDRFDSLALTFAPKPRRPRARRL